MNEIGSEFWDVPITQTKNQFFPKSTQWYLSGRSALQAILQELKEARTVAMPSWCCDSMIKPFIDAGMEVHFYPVYLQNELVQEIQTDSDIVFLMDYFGYTTGTTVSHPHVIRDVTHSVFSTSYSDAEYYFGSLRKWCGIWTGGYAWTRDGHDLMVKENEDHGYTLLREKAMELKKRYINGSIDETGNKIEDKGYLEYFGKAETLLENMEVVMAADRDILLAEKIDVDYMKKRRRANARMLMEAFPQQLIFPKLNNDDCPMFVPIAVPDGRRDDLRNYLIKNKIYCPVHWPLSPYHHPDKRAMALYNNELSLVCDQRYTEEDMARMIATINRFWKEEK